MVLGIFWEQSSNGCCKWSSSDAVVVWSGSSCMLLGRALFGVYAGKILEGAVGSQHLDENIL